MISYLPLIQKDSITQVHGLAVFVKETSFCTGLVSRKLHRLLLIFSTGFTSLTVSFFFIYRSPSSSCMLFYSISSNIDEVLKINPSANVFLFGDFNVDHKDWITYSGRTDRLVNSVILSQMTLFR